jgi:iron complex outermembrane receptor protein
MRIKAGDLVAVLLLPLAAAAQAQTQAPPAPAQPPPSTYKEVVDVVAVTPLPGLGVPRALVPVQIQVLTADDLRRSPNVSFGAMLSSRVASVNLNEMQANPFQPDLQFRGFVASPLLGLPQGLAVYQDGVRANEPFGDTMNWDLLPANAIASVSFMPGSSPLFGLNALGGALSIQTKTGFSHPGSGASVSAGSFGRRWLDAESGGHTDRWSYFVAGRLLAEDGWRDFSPSRLRQVFGSVLWRGTTSTLGATVTGGANRLIGNGPAPIQLLEEDRTAIFTHPDETKTETAQISLRGNRAFGGRLTIDGVLFYRPATIETFNGDDTTYDECDSRAFRNLLCADDGDGDPVRDQNGQLIPVDEDDPFTGTNNSSTTRTRGWGGSFQLSAAREIGGRANQFIAGASLDRAGSRYAFDTEIARLTGDRGTEGTGLFDAAAAVRLHSTATHTGAYVADFFTVVPKITVSGSARFTHSVVDLEDQLGDDLTGQHRFSRLNPSAGVTYQFRSDATAFASIGMASRVPAPSELGCADPEDPCRLPNAFISDPPLEQVVARTIEAGLRGRTRRVTWSGSAFSTTNRDDIIFISSGALTNEGHFANVGDTARNGVELTLSGAAPLDVRWDVSYTYLRARFRTPLTLSSPNHPDAVDGEIAIAPGDALPGVPRHSFRANVSLTAGRATIGADFSSTSSSFLRGDEANLLPPVAGRALLDLTAAYLVAKRIRLSARVTNLFGSDYSTFGLLGEADDVLGNEYDDPRFVSPGAPRAAWIGMEIVFR